MAIAVNRKDFTAILFSFESQVVVQESTAGRRVLRAESLARLIS